MHYMAEEASLRELNDSKTSGNLKSVYAMRVSHSNLASKAGTKPPPSANQAKRKHLKSAVPRTTKPANLTINEPNTGHVNLSQEDVVSSSTMPERRQVLTGKHLNVMSTLSTKHTNAAAGGASKPTGTKPRQTTSQTRQTASMIGHHHNQHHQTNTLQPYDTLRVTQGSNNLQQ